MNNKSALLALLILHNLLYGVGSFAVSDAVEQRVMCPASNTTPEPKHIPTDPDPDSPYVDPNQQIKSFGTDFIVGEFFVTRDKLFNYFKLSYETMDNAIKSFRMKHNLDEKAAYLMFKGGNVLRIVANQEFSLLPPAARNLLEKHYAKNFKRSDTDFTVIVNPDMLKGLDYETAMDELLELGHQALSDIRAELITNPEKYFNYLEYKQNYQQKILDKYFNKLNQLEMLSDPKNEVWFGTQFVQLGFNGVEAKPTPRCTYVGQYDYQFDFDKNHNIVGTLISNKPHWAAISINKTLEWPVQGSTKKQVKFYLERLKAQFEYTFLTKNGELVRKPISGELIDLSFQHRDDFRLKHFLENQDTLVGQYRITLDNTDHAVEIKSETLEGLADDLFSVVMEQFPRPWLDTKYEKRINRLFALSSAEMIGTLGLGSPDAKAYFKEVTDKVIEPLSTLYPLRIEDAKNIAANVTAAADDIKIRYEMMTTLNKIWQRLGTLVSKELIDNPQESDQKEFESLINSIKNNIKIFNQLCDMTPAKIDLNKIYNAKISSFF